MNTAIPAYLSRGDGHRAVFLLHGLGGGKALWEPQLDALAQAGWRAIAWDMPGYGDSAMVEPYAFAELARALERLIDHLAVTRAVVVGHSMGGMVALEALALLPNKIAVLVLSATSPAFGKPDGAWQQDYLRQRLVPLDEGKSMAEIAPGLVHGMVAQGADPAAVQTAIRIMSGVRPTTYRAAVHAMVGFDRRALLSAIAVPTLALAGDADPVAPPTVVQTMADKIPGARYQLLPRSGHLTSLEQPQRFNQAVLRFLSEQA